MTTPAEGTETLRSGLLTFVNSQVSLNPSLPILADTDLLLTGFVDSVGVFEIVAWLQQTTGVDIDPMHIVIENFQTVNQIVALVDRLRSGQH